VVDFEVFRSDLEAALSRSARAKTGRPPYEEMSMPPTRTHHPFFRRSLKISTASDQRWDGGSGVVTGTDLAVRGDDDSGGW